LSCDGPKPLFRVPAGFVIPSLYPPFFPDSLFVLPPLPFLLFCIFPLIYFCYTAIALPACAFHRLGEFSLFYFFFSPFFRVSSDSPALPRSLYIFFFSFSFGTNPFLARYSCLFFSLPQLPSCRPFLYSPSFARLPLSKTDPGCLCLELSPILFRAHKLLFFAFQKPFFCCCYCFLDFPLSAIPTHPTFLACSFKFLLFLLCEQLPSPQLILFGGFLLFLRRCCLCLTFSDCLHIG